MKFCYAKLSRLQVSGTANSVKLPACNSWKGMWAKVIFHPAQDKDYDGELIAIQFF